MRGRWLTTVREGYAATAASVGHAILSPAERYRRASLFPSVIRPRRHLVSTRARYWYPGARSRMLHWLTLALETVLRIFHFGRFDQSHALKHPSDQRICRSPRASAATLAHAGTRLQYPVGLGATDPRFVPPPGPFALEGVRLQSRRDAGPRFAGHSGENGVRSRAIFRSTSLPASDSIPT
jgi:hypothetical protein